MQSIAFVLTPALLSLMVHALDHGNAAQVYDFVCNFDLDNFFLEYHSLLWLYDFACFDHVFGLPLILCIPTLQ